MGISAGDEGRHARGGRSAACHTSGIGSSGRARRGSRRRRPAMEELGMDKTFQVAIGVSVVLFFITLNILFKDSFPSGVRNVWSRVTGTPAQVTVTTDTPVPPPVEEPKRKPKLRAHARIADPPEPLPEKKPPTEVVKVELPPPPFPTAQD